MAQQANYKLIKGFITTIHPKDKDIIGVGNGTGKFVWLNDSDIVDYFPKPMTQWKETVFKLPISNKKDWTDEKNFEKYGAKYSQKGIVLGPNDIPPADFYYNIPQQGFIDPYATTQPVQQQTQPQFIPTSQVPMQQQTTPKIKATDLMEGINEIKDGINRLTNVVMQLMNKMTTPQPPTIPQTIQPAPMIPQSPQIMNQQQPKNISGLDLPDLEY